MRRVRFIGKWQLLFSLRLGDRSPWCIIPITDFFGLDLPVSLALCINDSMHLGGAGVGSGLGIPGVCLWGPLHPREKGS